MDDFYYEEDEQQTEAGLDLRRYWNTIVKRWWLWSLVTLLVAAPWVWIVKQEKPIYEARATIQFRSYEGDEAWLAERRKEELLSRSFAEQVVAELGLAMQLIQTSPDSIIRRSEIFDSFLTNKKPEQGNYLLRVPGDGSFALYMVPSEEGQREIKLYAGQVAEAQRDTVELNGFRFTLAARKTPFPPEVQFRVGSFRNRVSAFQAQIESSFNRTGTLMWLKLRHQDPLIAMQMTNRLAELFVQKSRMISGGAEVREAEILKEKLRIAKESMESSKRKLLAFQAQNPELNAIDVKSNRIGDRLGRTELERDNLLRAQEAINELLQQADLIAPDGTRKNLLERNSIFKELVKLSVFNGNASLAIPKGKLENLEKDYIDVVNATSELNDQAVELATELQGVHKRIESIVRAENKNISSRIRRLNKDIDSLERQLRALPRKQSQLAELERESRNLTDLYTQLNTESAKFQVSSEVQTEDIHVLDPAIIPELPINGNKKAKALLGIIVGFLIGIGVTLSMEFFDKTMKTVNDVKRNLRVNVLGSIPKVDFKDVYDYQDSEKIKMIDNQLVTHDYAPTPIGEAYRSLRTSILFSKEVGRIQSLVVTSMAPGDGKSFTSANLAITMAQQKSNTLLVDCDLRRGVLHNTFGVSKEPGFSNYLTSSIPVPEIIHETHIPNLSVISCGSLIPNPSEVLGSHQMQRFLDECRRKFDLVIFDTPPLNAATDAVVIGTQVDATIIVIRAGKTHRDVARQKMELYQQVPAKVIGVILNGTAVDLAHEGYSYYHY